MSGLSVAGHRDGIAGTIRCERQEPDLARPLDLVRERPLVLRACARFSSRFDPASLRDVSPQPLGELVVNHRVFVRAEETDLPAREVSPTTGPASTVTSTVPVPVSWRPTRPRPTKSSTSGSRRTGRPAGWGAGSGRHFASWNWWRRRILWRGFRGCHSSAVGLIAVARRLVERWVVCGAKKASPPCHPIRGRVRPEELRSARLWLD